MTIDAPAIVRQLAREGAGLVVVALERLERHRPLPYLNGRGAGDRRRFRDGASGALVNERDMRLYR